MSAKLFSFNEIKHVGQPRYSAADMMARQLCLDTIENIKAWRHEAIEAVNAGQTDDTLTEEQRALWTEREKLTAEGYTTIDALMKGRHREAVLPLVLEAFPEIWAKEGQPN